MAETEKNVLNIKHASYILEKGLVFVPLLTGLAYLTSYFYGVGFLSMYGIPSQLAQIKIDNFIFIFLALSLISAYGYAVYDENQKVKIKIKHFYRNPFYLSLFIAVSLILLISLPPSFTAPLIIGAIVVCFFRIISPDIFKRVFSKKAVSDKRPVPMFLILIVVIWALCAISFLAGRLAAFSTDYYATFQFNGGRYAMLEAYNDKYILGRIKGNDEILDYRIVGVNFLADKPFKEEKLQISKFGLHTWFRKTF